MATKKKDESSASGPAVLERPPHGPVERLGREESLYSPEYSGRIWWYIGIRIDEERQQIPFHNSAFGGIPWMQGTQREVVVQEGWMGLEIHRNRLTPQILFARQVRRAVLEIKQKIIRWQARERDNLKGPARRWKADILSLENRIKTHDPEKRKFIPSGYRYSPGPNDEPISKYLVFIPRKKLLETADRLYEPNLRKIPTMLELDPSLIPDRMSGQQEDIAAGDEPW